MENIQEQLPKLGKLAARKDVRTLQFFKYAKALPPAPPLHKWSTKVTNWGTMLNTRIGDCTCAAAGHMIQEWSANSLIEITPNDDDIQKAYSDLSGYDPKTGLNDNGCVEIDVLNYWRKQGIAGHKIEAYAQINVHDAEQVKSAVFLFGGIYIGVALPITAQSQEIWEVPAVYNRNAVPGSWGGHAIFICDYDPTYVTCVTWGMLKKMTWDFFLRYVDEAYAIISPEFFKDGVAPNGFDIATLSQDLASI